MTDSPASMRGPGLRDRLHTARVAVRDALAAHPSIGLRDAIAEADEAVTAAMRIAIEAYERLAVEASSPAPPPHREGAGRPDADTVARLPPPRRLPTARPVDPT